MLELIDATHTIPTDDGDRHLLHKVTLAVPPGHFMAVVGPSGCGKSTLMKLVAGIIAETEGEVFWNGKNLADDGEIEPWELGYVPQFSIAYDQLSVEESIESAIRLRVVLLGRDQEDELLDRVLKETGLEAIRDRRVKVLSGGQKRRLGLAMELVSDPTLLLCDEVTSGLDPKSEEEIVGLMHKLSRDNPKRIVMNITHSLANMHLYDSVLVLVGGRVAYHGPPDALSSYFSVEHVEEIYPRLGQREPDAWEASWNKRRSAYYLTYGIRTNKLKLEEATTKELAEAEESLHRSSTHVPMASMDDDEDGKPKESSKKDSKKKAADDNEEDDSPETPGFWTQFITLLARRWKIFFRDRTQIILHLAMMIGFPILVVIFALDGIEPMKSISDRRETDLRLEQKQVMARAAQELQVGGLISGLVMFQVVLLTLMGANNSAREIAGERQIFEKEKLGGLHVSSYLASKAAFLAVLVLAQSAWMTFFVNWVIPTLPGDILWRFILLTLATGGMTSICLGISAVMKTPEQATLLSIYLVGFQLPLSGAVLALPKWIESFVQPFIAAFWSWAGSLQTISGSSFYSAVKAVTKTTLIDPGVGAYVLLTHVAVGFAFAWFGAKRHLSNL